MIDSNECFSIHRPKRCDRSSHGAALGNDYHRSARHEITIQCTSFSEVLQRRLAIGASSFDVAVEQISEEGKEYNYCLSKHLGLDEILFRPAINGGTRYSLVSGRTVRDGNGAIPLWLISAAATEPCTSTTARAV